MDIGDLFKKAREERGLSLREVSEKSGLSASFIGQIERNETSPSMRSVKSLTDALGVRLNDLLVSLDQIERSPHITPDRRRKMENIFNGIDYYLLTPDDSDSLQSVLIFARPGASSGEETFIHEGVEFGYILIGTLWFWVDGQEYVLREGDSFSFSCSSPHRYENKGVLPCVALWVATPPVW